VDLVKALLCRMSWDCKKKNSHKKKKEKITQEQSWVEKGIFTYFGSLAISKFQKENQSPYLSILTSAA